MAGSPPGPAVTIGWMERVLRYTMSKMPRDKIMAAVSVFGFDFNLTTGRNTYVTYQSAINLARRYNSEIISTGRVMRTLITEKDQEKVELLDGVKFILENGWALVLPDADMPFAGFTPKG